MLKAIYCGMGGNSFLCDVLKPVLLECGYDLTIISEWSNATVKWTRETWANEMVKGDVVICPQREGIQDGKSSIKAVTAMALGMPVIASPIPAYQEAIKQGENGFLASIHRLDEWRTALNALKDTATRQRIGKAARETAKRYSLDAIAGDWISLLREVSASQADTAPLTLPEIKPVHETVDLIIATYNNLPYIKLCLNSIWMNTDSPYRIIVSDAGSGPETWDYLKSLQGIVLLGSPGQRLNYSEAINAGVAAGNSKYFCVMNSDLIVSRGWLKAMVSHMGKVDRLACLGNLSNCNIDWTIPANYIQPIESKGTTLRLRGGMTIDEFGPHVEALNHFMAASNEQHKGVYHKREWVAAYCSLYARCAWEEVGGFDPIYKNGCEDLDHCIRLRRAGYEIGEAFDAFIFHAGGISRGSYQAENRESYRKEDEYNHRVKDAKWGKKKIGIYTGPGWEKWTRETVDAGMGGSETWAAELAAEFSRRGHQVFLFGDCQEPHIDRDGVLYVPHQEMDDTLLYDWLDVLICSRTVEPLRKKNLHASQVWVMIHDVFISQDPKVHEKVDWRIKGYAYLSDWHKDFLIQHHGLNPSKMWLTMNGVNGDLYRQDHAYAYGRTPNPIAFCYPTEGGFTSGVKRNQTVYSSSPDRGLLQLLQALPEIRKAVPDFKVLVAYGFDNIDVAIRNGNTQLVELKKVLELLMKQPGVEYLGRIDKKILARHQMESKVWLYPTWFQETFCITAVENGLARNAIISTDLAGIQTTVGKAGILVPWEGQYTEKYLRAFVAHAIQVLLNDQLRPVWANSAYEKAKEYTWQSAADGWERQFGWK